MTDIKGDAFLLDENINDIFERKIEVGAVIQFNLLQRLIEEFIKRQKSINDKVNNLEMKINEIQSMPIGQMIEDENIIKDFEETNINFEIEKDININKELKEKSNDNKKENDIDNNNNKDNDNNEYIDNNEYNENINKDENINNNDDETNKEKEIKKVNTKISSPKSINSSIQNKKILARMDKLENIVKELNKKLLNSNIEEKIHIGQIKNDLPDMKKYDDKIKNIEKNISKINKTLNEYSILDYLKKENIKEQDNENKDDSNNLENSSIIKMITKKIELFENKGKENDEDIFKLHKELNDINNAFSLHKNNYNEFVKEVSSNLNEIKLKHNNDINNIKNIINENIQEIKNELNNNIEQNNKKIKDMIIESSENIKNNNNSNNNNNTNFINAAKVNNEKLNNMNIELKNYINKSISDTEKYLKSIINNLGIDNIRKDLINLHQEINDKLSKQDLDYIDIKLNEYETKLNNLNLKIDMVKKDVNICNDTCTKSVKMIEYLSGQVVQAYQPDLEQAQREEMVKKLNSVNAKDLQSFLSRNEFDKELNNIYKKIEQTLEIESENYKFIQHIENRLKFFVTQNELRTMEQCIMNLIEEMKNEIPRKFMEKTEIMKNFKILELQIKNIYESSPNLLHIKENDNWLLAKKPINNYLCASCESYIGDLKNKNVYLPWNKIPSHDNKKYRMGNGFSRMLQLVNMDLMKSAEKVNNNLTIKIDEKKSNHDILKQLPRIGSQISMKHLNHPNSTFSLINNENLDNKLNNSADGLENLEGINNNNSNSNNIFSSNNSNSNNNIQELEAQDKNMPNNNEKENSPKLVKIVKKPKIEKKQ